MGLKKYDFTPQLRKLHAKGLNDYQIAERLNISQSWVCTKRQQLGLPINPATGQIYAKNIPEYKWQPKQIGEYLEGNITVKVIEPAWCTGSVRGMFL